MPSSRAMPSSRLSLSTQDGLLRLCSTHISSCLRTREFGWPQSYSYHERRVFVTKFAMQLCLTTFHHRSAWIRLPSTTDWIPSANCLWLSPAACILSPTARILPTATSIWGWSPATDRCDQQPGRWRSWIWWGWVWIRRRRIWR